MEDPIVRPNTPERPKLIAHRGFTPAAPQNTLAAFEAAGRRGFWAIETDVRKTRDGVLVCCHDADTNRHYQGGGPIEECTYQELSRLRPLRREDQREGMDCVGVPTFQSYLETCKRYGSLPFIETKTQDAGEVALAACRLFPVEEIIISSVVLDHLVQARRAVPGVFVHHIFSTPEGMEALARMGRSGLSYNYPDYAACPPELLEETHRAGVLCCLRAGDSRQAVWDMLRMGLDYIPTNRVDGLAEETN